MKAVAYSNDGGFIGSIDQFSLNSNPDAVDDFYNTEINNKLIGSSVLINDLDVNKDNLSIVNSTNPLHGSLSWNKDGSFEYTPNANYFGTDSFEYT